MKRQKKKPGYLSTLSKLRFHGKAAGTRTEHRLPWPWHVQFMCISVPSPGEETPQTLRGTAEMLLHFSEPFCSAFHSPHQKKTEKAYLKSFEHGSWLWISAIKRETHVQLLKIKRRYSGISCITFPHHVC